MRRGSTKDLFCLEQDKKERILGKNGTYARMGSIRVGKIGMTAWKIVKRVPNQENTQNR